LESRIVELERDDGDEEDIRLVLTSEHAGRCSSPTSHALLSRVAIGLDSNPSRNHVSSAESRDGV
jgi:hypothetical protein